MSSVCYAGGLNKMCKDDSFKFEGDKQAHLMVSTVIGATSRSVISDPYIAFGVSLLPGLYREGFKKDGCFSVQDELYNIIGSTLGVSGMHVIIRHNFIGFQKEI